MKNTHSLLSNKLFIFEMANNHMGDVNHAKEMINEYSKVILKYPDFQFGFKLQFRNLKKFIHKSKQNREDLHYIKRFNETKLSNKKFKIIIIHTSTSN